MLPHGTLLRQFFPHGAFTGGVKSEQAQADYQNGILTIRIPKVEPARMKGRRIDIH